MRKALGMHTASRIQNMVQNCKIKRLFRGQLTFFLNLQEVLLGLSASRAPHGGAMLFVIYAGFSTVGYLSYGPGAQSNILLTLPTGPWGEASRFFYVLVILSSYPLFVYPLIDTIRGSRVGSGVRKTNTELVARITPCAAIDGETFADADLPSQREGSSGPTVVPGNHSPKGSPKEKKRRSC